MWQILSGSQLFCAAEYPDIAIYENIDGGRRPGLGPGIGHLWLGRPADIMGI